MPKSKPIVLTTDKEFSGLFWDHAKTELELLSKSLREDGCREPIRYWSNAPDKSNPIIDGHTRKKICDEKEIYYDAKGMEFASRDEVILWIYQCQLARRNISEQQRAYQLGKYTDLRKQSPGRPRDEFDEPDDQTKAAGRTVEIIAEETGLSPSTVARAQRIAKQADELRAKSPYLADAIVAGKIHFTNVHDVMGFRDPILRELENVPVDDLKKAVKAQVKKLAEIANKIKPKEDASPEPSQEPEPEQEPEPRKLKPGTPVSDIRAIKELEDALGIAVRKSTDALKACGGQEFHAELKHHFNDMFDQVAAWRVAVSEGKVSAA